MSDDLMSDPTSEQAMVCIPLDQFNAIVADAAAACRPAADGSYKDLASAHKAWAAYKALVGFCPACEPPNPPPQPPPAS